MNPCPRWIVRGRQPQKKRMRGRFDLAGEDTGSARHMHCNSSRAFPGLAFSQTEPERDRTNARPPGETLPLHRAWMRLFA